MFLFLNKSLGTKKIKVHITLRNKYILSVLNDLHEFLITYTTCKFNANSAGT